MGALLWRVWGRVGAMQVRSGGCGGVRLGEMGGVWWGPSRCVGVWHLAGLLTPLHTTDAPLQPGFSHAARTCMAPLQASTHMHTCMAPPCRPRTHVWSPLQVSMHMPGPPCRSARRSHLTTLSAASPRPGWRWRSTLSCHPHTQRLLPPSCTLAPPS